MKILTVTNWSPRIWQTTDSYELVGQLSIRKFVIYCIVMKWYIVIYSLHLPIYEKYILGTNVRTISFYNKVNIQILDVTDIYDQLFLCTDEYNINNIFAKLFSQNCSNLNYFLQVNDIKIMSSNWKATNIF